MSSKLSTWDVIVIGSGMGGLTSAAYLAAAGKRVLVLESGDLLGGSTHVFRRKQFEFEVGVHYLGDCGSDGAIPTMLRGVGLDDRVDFLPMDPDGFDTICYPGVTVKVPKGWDAYLANLIEAFPGDGNGLRTFVGVMRDLGEATDRITSPTGLPSMAASMLRAGSSSVWTMRPLQHLLDHCNLSIGARSVLSSQASYLSPPHRAATMTHAAFLHNYIKDGGWFPAGGGQVLSAHLASVVRAHGGDWRTHARVHRILIEHGTVTGVELTDGEQIRTKVVVSNADLKRTLLELVGPDHLPWRAFKRAQSFRMSMPLVNLYLGLDIDLRGRMPVTNYFSYPVLEPSSIAFEYLERAGTLTEPEVQALYSKTPGFVSVQSVKDPDCHRIAPPGYSNLEVMTAAPADYRFWGIETGPYDGGKYRRGETYLRRKAEITEVLLDRAETVIPGVRDSIVWSELATPITQERYTLSTAGVAYGIDMSWFQFGPLRPGSRTPIKGLFTASASNGWGPGVEGAMASGVGAAGAVLGRNLGIEIRRGRTLGDSANLPTITTDWDPLMEVGGPEHQRAVRVDQNLEIAT
jgi:all-trans-retinol 13,14-reductase